MKKISSKRACQLGNEIVARSGKFFICPSLFPANQSRKGRKGMGGYFNLLLRTECSLKCNITFLNGMFKDAWQLSCIVVSVTVNYCSNNISGYITLKSPWRIWQPLTTHLHCYHPPNKGYLSAFHVNADPRVQALWENFGNKSHWQEFPPLFWATYPNFIRLFEKPNPCETLALMGMNTGF